MNYYYLVAFFSFIPLISLASVSTTVCEGQHLGEICDYRRICLDENAKCVGQTKSDSLFGRREYLLKYKCQCARFYEEDDGKCIFSNTITAVLVVATICIVILLLFPFIIMVKIIKKTVPPIAV